MRVFCDLVGVVVVVVVVLTRCAFPNAPACEMKKPAQIR